VFLADAFKCAVTVIHAPFYLLKVVGYVVEFFTDHGKRN
jgi:hypothetical protein